MIDFIKTPVPTPQDKIQDLNMKKITNRVNYLDNAVDFINVDINNLQEKVNELSEGSKFSFLNESPGTIYNTFAQSPTYSPYIVDSNSKVYGVYFPLISSSKTIILHDFIFQNDYVFIRPFLLRNYTTDESIPFTWYTVTTDNHLYFYLYYVYTSKLTFTNIVASNVQGIVFE